MKTLTGGARNGQAPAAEAGAGQPPQLAPLTPKLEKLPSDAVAPVAAASADTQNEPLEDASGTPLPQTDELPSLDSASFKRRLDLLFTAIVADDAELAKSAFFPLLAYEQVKAIAQPARDWKYRLFAAFRRNIHEYHQSLGREPRKARLLGIESSGPQPRWMKPGSEGNRLGYHRLLRAQLRVLDGDGHERRFEITSMISWRGEWYVVHLHGFK